MSRLFPHELPASSDVMLMAINSGYSLGPPDHEYRQIEKRLAWIGMRMIEQLPHSDAGKKALDHLVGTIDQLWNAAIAK